MHLPDSVGEKATKATKKKPLEAVSIFGSAGTVLEEFGITESGNEIQCYVQVSPGDTITLGFELPWSDGQIVDIFVDGILRETNVTTSRPVNIHRGKIVNVCACEIRPSGAKGKLEYCDMVVEDRKTTNDISPSTLGFNNLQPSAVGSIEVRVLREIHLVAKSHKDVKPEQATRGPTFENNLRWWDFSKRVDSGIVTPTYQIGFINGRKTHGNSRKNINRSIEGYYLWALFKFLYRSASDIRAAGFDTVGNPPNLSSNSKGDRSANLTGKMANTLSAAAIATDEKPFISLKALPELSINQAGSGSHQPPEIATVKATGENENSGHVELMKDELEVAASAKAAQVFDSATVIAHEDLKNSEITGNQRSYRAYCETECSDDEVDPKQEVSHTEVEMGNRKKTDHGRPTEPEKPEKQTPLPGWSRRLAISMAEEVIMSGATNSIIVAEDSRQPTEGDDTTPLVFQSKGSQDSGGFEQPLSHHGGSSNLSQTSLEYSQQNYGHSLESLPKEARQISHSQDSSDAVSLPTTSLHLAGAGATLQESGTGPEIGIAAQPVFANNQRAAPNLFMRAKAGHYATRSPLVAPDTEDLERHAKAMTNGKGDWRNRVTQMLQVLSAPPKNRALTEGSPSRTAPEAPAAQNLATMSLPNSISGAPKKRSFSEFNVDDAGALRSNSSRIPSFSIQNGQNMSPKARREEHARKRQAKQEALDKAKAEADALRRQVAEIEAGQAEAIAREEAELEELDMEIGNIQEEAAALAARLRELHEQ